MPPWSRDGDVHTFQSFVVRLNEEFGLSRDNVIRRLGSRGIEAQIGTYALHLQPTFRRGMKTRNCKNSELAYEHTLSLPISSVMKRAEVDLVVNALVTLAR